MSNYFSKLPNFEYVSRLPDAKISDYIAVKNLFKRGAIPEDILDTVALFTKYQIRGDDRPDNVAFFEYGDEDLDWIVLACNNIINIQSEWPMTQEVFNDYLLNKYGSYENMYEIHHYETIELRTFDGLLILEGGLIVDEDFTFTHSYGDVQTHSPVTTVTNYEYEEMLEDKKRSIFLLKPEYVAIVKDDFESIMGYERGSEGYINKNMKRGDNIRLY
tara:strand:- start:5938 stop:6588 length:651 start_codon:yes stop_codon:yes gene_type:complete